jgi:hypothetical protein
MIRRSGHWNVIWGLDRHEQNAEIALLDGLVVFEGEDEIWMWGHRVDSVPLTQFVARGPDGAVSRV